MNDTGDSMTRHEIQAQFAATILKATGLTVEVTHRDAGKWTISGDDNVVRKAAEWLRVNVGMVVESIDYDDDLEESFAYLAA